MENKLIVALAQINHFVTDTKCVQLKLFLGEYFLKYFFLMKNYSSGDISKSHWQLLIFFLLVLKSVNCCMSFEIHSILSHISKARTSYCVLACSPYKF